MKTVVRLLIWLIGSTFFISHLTGCSGGGSGGNPGPETVSIKGVAQAGPIDGKVTIYELDTNGNKVMPPLGTQEDVKEGVFSISVPKGDHPVIIAASGTYKDEATGAIVDMKGQELTQIVADTQQSSEVPVTPATTFVADMVKEKIRKGELLRLDAARAMGDAQQKVAQLFGVDVNTIKAVPLPPEKMNVNSDSGKAALLLTSLSQAMKDGELSADQGVNPIEVLKNLSSTLAQKKEDEQKISGSDFASDPKLQSFGSKWATKLTEARDKVAGDKGIMLPENWAPPKADVGKNSVNYSPEAQGDTITVWDNQPERGLTASDKNGDLLEFSITQQPTNGTIILTHKNRGGFQFVPQTTQVKTYGPDSFKFRVFDGEKYSESVTVSIQILPRNGFYDGKCYVNGKELGEIPDSTGYCAGDSLYYIKGVAFPGLDSQGNGTSGGELYQTGALAKGAFGGEYYQDGRAAYKTGLLQTEKISPFRFPDTRIFRNSVHRIEIVNPTAKQLDPYLIYPQNRTFSVGSENCSLPLAPQIKCYIDVRFSPNREGEQTDQLIIMYKYGNDLYGDPITLQGNGTPGAFLGVFENSVSDYYHGFPATRLFESSTKTFTVKNLGASTATHLAFSSATWNWAPFVSSDSPFKFKGGIFPGVGGTCQDSLPPDQSCSIVIEYIPTKVGFDWRELVFTYDDRLPGTNYSSALFGAYSYTPADLELSDLNNLDFGSVDIGKIVEKTITVAHSAGSIDAYLAITLNPPFSFKKNGTPFGGSCGEKIPPGTRCNMVIEFTPTSTSLIDTDLKIQWGSFDGVDKLAGTEKNIVSHLTGRGFLKLIIETSDHLPTFDFGLVKAGEIKEKSLTIINPTTISTDLENLSGITPPFFFKDGKFPGTGGTCSSKLEGKSSCTISFQYSPSQPGSFSSQVSVSSRGISAVTQSNIFTVRGTAFIPLTIRESLPYTFTPSPVGHFVEKEFLLTNPSQTDISELRLSGLSAPFGFKNGSYPGSGGTCTSKLAPGESCTLVIVFEAAKSGYFTGKAAITYKQNGISIQSEWNGTGIAFKSGMPDPSFSGGAVSFNDDYGNIATRRKIAISTDGKIAFPTTLEGAKAVSVFRLRPDGTPDTDFNKTGSVSLNLGYEIYLNALAMSHDGNSIIGTGFRYYSDDLLFLRVSTQGIPDPALQWSGSKTKGATIISGLGQGIELFSQPSGKILVRTSKRFLVRLNENGTLDDSFDFANQTLVGTPEDVLVFPDGTFLVSGTHSIVSNHNELWVSKFDVNGNLVSSFGDHGTSIYDPGLHYRADSSQLLKLDSDRFLLVSSAQRGNYLAPLRCIAYRSACLKSTGSVCGPGEMGSVCVSYGYGLSNGTPTEPSNYSDLAKFYYNDDPLYHWSSDYKYPSPSGALTISYQNNGIPQTTPNYVGFSIPSIGNVVGAVVTTLAKLQFAEVDSRGRLVLTVVNMSGKSVLSSNCIRILQDGSTQDSSFIFSPQSSFLIEDFRLQPDDKILFLAPLIVPGAPDLTPLRSEILRISP